MWRVFWSNGGEGVYATGQDDKYELQHLQVGGRPCVCVGGGGFQA